MRIEEYLVTTGQSQATFGAKLTPPASQSLVSQWIAGTTQITLRRALNIRAVSNGAITLEDCIIEEANT